MKTLRKMSPILIVCLIVALGLIGCKTIDEGASGPVVTPATRTQPSPTRPALLVQFCDDDTGSYPRADFQGANQLMASSLTQAVSANQQGVTLYATAITHDTFNPVNTLVPAFQIPAIASYPTVPTPIPTAAPQDPVTDNATATAIADKNNQGVTAYNHVVLGVDQQVQAAQHNITTDVKRLTSWDPPVDDIGTSVLGCFQLAASRFQGQSGVKLLYIASDLENNTDVDYTQNFVTSHALQGVIVHVIYFYSQNAGRDQQKRANWCPYLESAGATSVTFNDPGESLSNVLNHDWNTPARSC